MVFLSGDLTVSYALGQETGAIRVWRPARSEGNIYFEETFF